MHTVPEHSRFNLGAHNSSASFYLSVVLFSSSVLYNVFILNSVGLVSFFTF